MVNYLYKLVLILSLFALVAISGNAQLNQKIVHSQRLALKHSPFRSAKGIYSEVSKQKKYRLQYLTVVDSLLKTFPNDTLLIIESYNFICSGCKAMQVQIQVDKLFVTFTNDSDSFLYARIDEKIKPDFTDEKGQLYSDIQELKAESAKSADWAKYPAKYGTDQCFDGSHTLYTFIYPNNAMISMYMRCWLEKRFRK